VGRKGKRFAVLEWDSFRLVSTRGLATQAPNGFGALNVELGQNDSSAGSVMDIFAWLLRVLRNANTRR